MKSLKCLASVMVLFSLTIFAPHAKAEVRAYSVKLTVESQLTPNFSVIGNKDTKADLERAFSLFQAKDYRGAIQLFSQVINADPNNAQAYLGRGSSYLMLDNYQQAKKDLDKSINLNSEIGFAYFFRGLSNYALGNKESAISDLETAANLFQKEGEAELAQKSLDAIKRIRNA